MKTEETIGSKTRVIELLDATKKQLEKFRIELSQTPEPEKKYQLLKEELKGSIVEMKKMIDENSSINQELTISLREKLVMLEEELNISNKSALDDLKRHLTNIKSTLSDIVKRMNEEGAFNETLEKIHDRLHQYKIKFEIIKLKLALGSMEMRNTVKDAQRQVTKKINSIKNFVDENEEIVEKKWKNFRKEVTEVYEVLHKTFTSK